jgi:hypothetical protein
VWCESEVDSEEGTYRTLQKRKHSDSTEKFSETDIINMLEFLIDNIFAIFAGRVFQQTVWVQTVLLFSPTFIVLGRLHTAASQEKRKEASPIL